MQKYKHTIYTFVAFFLFSVITVNFILNFQPVDNFKYFDINQENNFEYDQLKSSEQEINIATPENITYTAPMSGYYPANIGFENDPIGSNPDGWMVDEPSGTNVNVISEKSDHKNVLELYDGDTIIYPKAYSPTFDSNKSSGIIELWFYASDVSKQFYPLIIRDYTDQYGVVIQNWGGYLAYNDGTGYQNFANISSNTWYHLRVDFDCLIDKHDIYLNGEKKVSQQSYKGDVNGLEFIYVQGGSHSPLYLYIDAIGYSWDSNYNIGDNLNEGLLLSYDITFTPEWQGYSLDEKANHTILGNTTIPIPDDGVHSIQVFGNNSIGAIYQSVLRYFSIDITTPIISINNPYPNEFFGNNAPNFEISIDEPNLNTTWYTIDNGLTNKTFTGFTGTINQTEWGKLSNGSVIIHFYANDTWGFEGNTKVGVWKDTYAPTSSILFVPYSGFNIVNETTEFSLIAGDGIGSGVSTIRYKINDSSWITYIEPFNLSSYDYGVYIITYQAIDNVGNIETENIQLVELIKEPGPSEPTIHGYNLWIVIGIISIISAMVISKRIKK